jgi:transposase
MTRTFGTMTADLLALASWLGEESDQVEHIAMESTGVYWYPVYNLLEDGCTVVLVNPQHIKAVPGRKTDVKDSEWLADLLRHGLLKASFIPPQPIRELRELTRYRKRLVQERTQAANRLQKVLESANLKVGAIATDLLGVSGRAMLEALIAARQTPAEMAHLARGRLRSRLPALQQALEGRVTDHHRFLLRQMLTQVDFLDQAIGQVQMQIERQLEPYHEAMELLQTIPGISATSAAAIIAEIGVDMTRFPSACAAQAPGLLGRTVPGEQAKRGQTTAGGDQPGQPLATGRLRGSRLGGEPHQGQLSGRAVPAHRAAAWQV